MNTPLVVAMVQQACGTDREQNIELTLRFIRDAASQGAKLVVLQELHCGPYFCQYEDTAVFDTAEPIPGPATARLGMQAAESGVVIVSSLFERRAAGVYHNTAVVFNSDGSIAGKYRKMHIPDDPGYYEKFYFTPGDLGFHPIQTSVGKLGVLVCWDQWFPEAARMMALRGAEMLIYPTAIGWTPSDADDEKHRQRDAWMTVQRSHAIANGLPVIVANRVGYEPDISGASEGLHFWGSSFAAGPQGETIAQGGIDAEQVIIAEIDRSRTEQVRRIWPFLRDRRVDAYAGLDKRLLDEA
ncbi:MAG: carbon-nitrogen hydrolase [Candidatus Hydrogenedentes bacterium]|nr:carbon-nitrogen hydrolase [Candidatus Hydrogenedentota bacterium]